MSKRLAILFVLLLTLALAGSALAAGTVVVNSGNVGVDWFLNDTRTGGAVGFAAGPATPPLGAGSLRMTSTDAFGSGQAKAQFFHYGYMGTPLADIDQLDYWVYRDSASTNSLQQTITMNMEIDYVGDGSSYATLVYEPTYNGYQGPMLLDTWQQWDAFDSGNAVWWSTKDIPGVCAWNCFVPWNTILANNPNAVISYAVGFNIGSGWVGQYTGYADALSVGVLGDTTTFDFEPQCTTDCYVDAVNGSDSNSGLDWANAKQTLQGALLEVSAGGTVHMAAGTYNEVGQIHIDRDLTITGVDQNTVILHPTANTSNSGDARGWFLVDSGVTFDLDNVTLDGNGYLVFQAIRNKGQGSVDAVTFNDIRYQASGSPYSGVAIAAFGTGPVDVTNSTFSQIGRIGVLYFGSGVNGSVFSGNSYTGKGAGDWLDYALDISAGAQVTVSNNTVSDNLGVAASDGSGSAAFIATSYYGAGTSAYISGNTITNNSYGIIAGYNSSDTSAVTAYCNNISGNTYYGVYSTGPAVNAESNWWGDASGPSGFGPGTGDAVSDYVDFTPWAILPDNCDAVMTSFTSYGYADGWVLERAETYNTGYQVDNKTKLLRVGDDRADRQYKVVLDFDTSGIPAGATVIGAALEFKQYSTVGTPFDGSLGALQVELKDGFFHNSWRLERQDFEALADGLSATTLATEPGDGNWVSIDISDLAGLISSGRTQLRLSFELDDNDNRRDDYLMLYGGYAGANAPRLVIYYTAP